MSERSMDLRVQEEILKKHQENDDRLLKKYSGNSFGSNLPNLDVVYAINWLEIVARREYLPMFEARVQTFCEIDFRPQMDENNAIHPYLMEKEGLVYFRPKGSESSKPLKLTLSPIPNLFYLRNMISEGKSLSESIIKEKDSKMLIDESQISAKFTVHAMGSWQGFSGAEIPIDYPGAEMMIKQYLETIDGGLRDFEELKQHYNPENDMLNQSQEYNTKGKKLSNLLFGELKEIVESNGFELKNYF